MQKTQDPPVRLTRQGLATVWLLVGVIIGMVFGYTSGKNDMMAQIGVYEDGSYSAGCLAGAPCEKE